MHPDMYLHLKALSRAIFYVTEEEDRFLMELNDLLKGSTQDPMRKAEIHVYNPTVGFVPLAQHIADWADRSLKVSTDCPDIHRALVKAYQSDPGLISNGVHFYVFLDPERYLSNNPHDTDKHVERRLLNLLHQLHQNEAMAKVIIFVSNKLSLPNKLRRYFEVVHDRGLTDDQIEKRLTHMIKNVKAVENSPPVTSLIRHFRSLTSFEIDAAVTQSVIKTRRDHVRPKRVDPKYISEYRRQQLQKTDLLTFVDTSDSSFAQLGGLDQYKKWAEESKVCWTEEGRKFGLEPPKGVLCVGVWGCGKSEATKALGTCWGLPVIQLEMGRLRSSGVGDTESNIYRATHIIEGLAPCILWVDEGEKTMSGGHSSSYSDAGTTSRSLGILSTWFQETKAPICMAMTANNLKTLPVEFVNRIEERFFFDLPSEDERIAIIALHLLKKNQDPKKFQLAELGEASKNMVGREIWQCVKAALRTSFNSNSEGLDHKILLDEMRRKPRIFKTMVDELKEVIEWVGYDEEVQDGVRARFASLKRSETFQEFRVAKPE